MIQPLRALHRRTFITLAVLLPVILLIGLRARHPVSVSSSSGGDAPDGTSLVYESNQLWRNHRIGSKFYRSADRPQKIYIVIRPLFDVSEPDLLLYWSRDALHGDSLPVGAQLVGAFVAGKAFSISFREKPAGTLILFSLAHKTVFDVAKLEDLP